MLGKVDDISINNKRFIGVISDTHGLVRPQVIDKLQGAELIIHAGDIGKVEVIEQLKAVAPVVAIRGNVDSGSWASEYAVTEMMEFEDNFFYVLHDLNELDIDPVAAGISCVISGHSHRSKIDEYDGVMYLNPGSCGPRRFTLPVSLARIWIRQGGFETELIELET